MPNMTLQAEETSWAFRSHFFYSYTLSPNHHLHQVDTWAPIWKHLGKRLGISSQISPNRAKGEYLKTVSQQSCLETVQESIVTRDGLRQEPHFSCRNTSLRSQIDLVDSPSKKKYPKSVCQQMCDDWVGFTQNYRCLFSRSCSRWCPTEHITTINTLLHAHCRRTTHKTKVPHTASLPHYPPLPRF